MEILFLMAKGQTNPEISQTLSISKHTAKSHVISIFNKLGVKNSGNESGLRPVVWLELKEKIFNRPAENSVNHQLLSATIYQHPTGIRVVTQKGLSMIFSSIPLLRL